MNKEQEQRSLFLIAVLNTLLASLWLLKYLRILPPTDFLPPAGLLAIIILLYVSAAWCLIRYFKNRRSS